MKQPQTRMTRQRAIILEELQKLKTHPSADEVYAVVREKLPRISLGTVYRNLDFLAETGSVRLLEVPGAVRRFDGDISPHQHVRCIHCGRIGDVPNPLPTPSFERLSVAGFSSIVGARVEFDGICDACASGADRVPPAFWSE